MGGWLVGWLAGWLVGWLAGWLVGWLAGLYWLVELVSTDAVTGTDTNANTDADTDTYTDTDTHTDTDTIQMQMQIQFCRLVACNWSFAKLIHIQTQLQKYCKTDTDHIQIQSHLWMQTGKRNAIVQIGKHTIQIGKHTMQMFWHTAFYC